MIIFKDEIEPEIFKFCEQLANILKQGNDEETMKSYCESLHFAKFLFSYVNMTWESEVKEGLLTLQIIPELTPALDEIFFYEFPPEKTPTIPAILSIGLERIPKFLMRRSKNANKKKYKDDFIPTDEVIMFISQYPNRLPDLTEVFSIKKSSATYLINYFVEKTKSKKGSYTDASSIIKCLFTLIPVLSVLVLRGAINCTVFLPPFNLIKQYGLKNHFLNNFRQDLKVIGSQQIDSGIKLFLELER